MSGREWLRGSLRNKFLLPLLLLSVSVGVAGSILILRYFSSAMTTQLQARAAELAQAVNYAVETTSRQADLQRFVAALGANRDIVSIMIVVDQPPVVLAATEPAWLGRPLAVIETDEENRQSVLRVLAGGKPSMERHREDAHVHYVMPLLLSNPTKSELNLDRGVVMLELRTEAIHGTITRSARVVIALFLLSLAIGLALVWRLLDRLVLAPAEAISAAMQRRAAGDLSAYAPAGIHDEIGQLAAGLNRMLDAVTERDLRLQRVLEGSGAGYWDWNLETNAISFGGSLAARLGYRDEDFEPDYATWEKRVHPEDLPQVRAAIAEVVAGRSEQYESEYRIRAADGSWRWILEHGRASSRAAGGRALRVAGTQVDISRRREMEQALRTSEALLSSALQLARAAYWEYEVDTDRFTFNDNFYRVYRSTAADIGGYTMTSAEYARRFVHPDDAPIVAREVQASIETTDPGFTRELEHRVIFGDGQPGFVAVRFFVVKDAEGRTVRTFGVNQDITERRQAELKLDESDARLRALFQGMLEGYAYCRLLPEQYGFRDFIYLDVNPAFSAITGLRNVIGKKVTDVIPRIRESNPEIFERSARVVRSGRPEHFEVRIEALKSKWLTVSFYRTEPGCFTAVFSDITERKLMEVTQARMAAIVESSRDGIMSVNMNGIVTSWNYGAEKIYGYTEAEMLGQHVRQLAPPERADESERIILRIMLGEEAIRFETVRRRKDGRLFDAAYTFSPILDERAGIVGVSATLQDISERKQAQRKQEAALRRVQAQLAAVGEIGNSQALMLGDVEGLARQLTELAARACGAERANVWLFNEAETELRCIDLYEATPGRHSAGMLLQEHEYHNEFQALKQAKHVAADDPLTDPRTAGYVEGYLKPLRITSMLDTVVHVSGRNMGLLCIEHVDQPHHWEQDEIVFASQLADKIGLALINRERRRAEAGLVYANRALRTLSAGNQALVRARSEAELMQETCRVITETGGYCMAWIGLARDDAERTVEPVAVSGFEDGYLQVANISWADSERGRGPTGTAIRTGALQVSRNIGSDPLMQPWSAEAALRGYAASVALPLMLGTKALGALNIYAAEADAFGAAEMKLLGELADNMMYGVTALRSDLASEQVRNRLAGSMEATIFAIAATVEKRDLYTAGHQRRVADLAVAIARELALPEDRIHGLGLAAAIHDVGKIHIPAEILSKPTRLTAVEYQLVQSHPQAGYEILKDVDFPWPIAEMVYQHHEQMDGTGYPRRLKGEQILLEARIISVADTVESMASHRPYRPALGQEAALQEIIRKRGTSYDAAVVDACVKLFRERGYQLPTARIA